MSDLVSTRPGVFLPVVGQIAMPDRAAWPTVVLSLVAIIAAASAFVGLGASSWWTDELFTLFVVDHEEGIGGVISRALTDTHPPAYYLLLHAWTRVFGAGEVAARLPSAMCAVLALAVFARTALRIVSPGATAFASAIAGTSMLWFMQSQNARSYALCLLVSAVLLSAAVEARRSLRADSDFPWRVWATIAVAGGIGAFSHFYMLLATGAVIGFLILTTPHARFRAGLIAAGLTILLLSLLYMRALAGSTEQDFQEMWFRRDLAHLLGVWRGAFRGAVGSNPQYAVLILAVVAIVAPLVRARDPEPRANVRSEPPVGPWSVGLAAFVLVGMYAAGVAVSVLYAPSISDQNMLVAAPFAWLLLAGLYDRGVGAVAPHAREGFVAVLVVLVVVQLAVVGGRPLPRNQEWRASGVYVAAVPGCETASIPVVRPHKFGPDTPFFRELTRTEFFGRVFPGDAARLVVRSPAAFMTPEADPAFVALLAERASASDACPVLAWAVHDIGLGEARRIQRAMARLPGVAPAEIRMRVFAHKGRSGLRWTDRASAYVFEAVRPVPTSGAAT